MPEQPKPQFNQPKESIQPKNLHNLSILTPQDKLTPEYQRMRERIDAVKEEMKKVAEDQTLTKAEKLKLISGELMKKLETAQRFQRKGETTVVIAQTLEGQEIIFDPEQIKQESIDLFSNLNLKELTQAIEETEINLTPEQTDQIIAKAKEGFNKFYLLPPIELQQQYLNQIKEETGQPITGLTKDNQYNETPDNTGQTGVWLSDTVKPNFPDKIAILNRPKNQPYLLFIKDNREVDKETLSQTPVQLRELFKQRNETGLILSEYLIFQRDYTQRHQEHPDKQRWTWLLDSVIKNKQGGPGRVLNADWGSGSRQVGAHSSTPVHQDSDGGARSSAIFAIL